MREALLDMRTFFRDLTDDQRERVLAWCRAEGVPVETTFAALFGEGRVTIFAYDEPIRWDATGTCGVEKEPEVYHVKTPPPLDVLRLIVTDDRRSSDP